jgi:flavin-dependent dehydrogenase
MTDAIIVGGGLAGGALAARLASAGRAVVVLERESAPADKVCGEFLSHEAMRDLGHLGLDLPALGAVPIDAVRVFVRNKAASARLPFTACSLSRKVLDEALLCRAAALGAQIRRGARVRSLELEGKGWAARLDDGERLIGGAGFLATGKHDLPGQRRPPGWQHDLVAFKMHFVLSSGAQAALARTVEIVLFEGGYAGLQPVEGGRANLCLVVRRARLARLGRSWPGVLSAVCGESAHLVSRLDGAVPCWPRPLALSSIPYGHLQRGSDGIWRLGDQAAVIPSFAGDGMSIALHSAGLAASMYLGGQAAPAYQRRLASDVTRQMVLATLISQGLVRGITQRALGYVVDGWPGLLTRVAAGTRIPESALARAS